MIRFRPCHKSISESIKGELIFNNTDEMIQYVFDRWSHVVAFLGGSPFRMDEISIGDMGSHNPLTGYKDEHPIFVQRMIDKPYCVPMCIGYCDLEGWQ